MTTKDWKQFTSFYFYTLLSLSLGVAAMISDTRSLISILSLCLVGLLMWGLFEYGLHRFIFHIDRPGDHERNFIYGLHRFHHANPKNTDDLFVSLRLSLPIVLCYCSAAWAITRSWHVTVYLFIGLIAVYFSYEKRIIRLIIAPRLRVLRYLKVYHLLHHHRLLSCGLVLLTPV